MLSDSFESKKMILVNRINVEDDIESLVAQINAAQWDERNEMGEYQADALKAYLQRADTLFIACYQCTGAENEFLGMASARLEMKPYDREMWLYVDEVDVCANHRRKGAASAMMNHLLEYAADHNCAELWLGTEADNTGAQQLYQSLEPDEVGQFVGYTYEVEGTEYA